ncbi:uncharacterized protein PFLUO_LOCUS4718 [Penicillium psychrofluorescens]|uniref:uncharacterized protein n=1 Tax=Penicillium psychrofluorescens TaxID=3158075 RepID=UPI003CCE2CF1
MVSRSIDIYDKISIGDLVVYSFYLVGGIYLCWKHGLARSAGFRFLVILSLARLIGESMRLASIHDAYNKNLYIGWMVTNSMGLGPLVLMLVGLLSRAFDSIHRNGPIILKPLYRRIVEALMAVALILLLVGGTQSKYNASGSTITIHYNSLSRVGIILMIVVTVLLLIELFLAWCNRQYIVPSEKLILPAVAVSMPLIIVRLTYSCLRILDDSTYSAWVMLGMDVIMEFIVCLIVEIAGFALDKAPEQPKQDDEEGYIRMGLEVGRR